MNQDRDPEADDLFVDSLLQEEVGGNAPRDHAARIAAATAAERARAAERVAAASKQLSTPEPANRTPEPANWTPEPAKRRHYRHLLFVAAAMLVVAIGAIMLANSWPTPPTQDQERTQALLDEFHRVMPRYPANLRDEPRRSELVGKALPALREIIDFGHSQGKESIIGQRILEFEIYAATIGDRELMQTLAARAARGDATANGQLLVTRLITNTDAALRASLVSQLAQQLAQLPQDAASLTMCLEAAELTTQEAEQLATGISDPMVANALVLAAELAQQSPRRLLGQALSLQGKLLDSASFNNGSLNTGSFDSDTFNTDSLRGKPILVCFWATWCPPSLEAVATIVQVRRNHPELAVVGVSCDHDVRTLRNFLADNRQVDWPQFFDQARPGWHELAFLNNVKMVPFVLLIDATGIVREVDVASEVAAAVQRMLAR